MNNRLGGLKPKSRIDRENKKKYDRLAKAQIETLRYYFDKEWFDGRALLIEANKKRKTSRYSKYNLKRCPDCNKIWNIYQNKRKKLCIQYWNKFQNLPAEKDKCGQC
tara:strand:+ start:132 stop:452 length:321 start_codon:yes stop_codon:yes gene_type:complete